MIINCNFYLWLQALEMQIRELEDRKRAFEQEKHEWESTNGITVDELKRRSLEANSKEWVFFQCIFFSLHFFYLALKPLSWFHPFHYMRYIFTSIFHAFIIVPFSLTYILFIHSIPFHKFGHSAREIIAFSQQQQKNSSIT